MKTSIATVLAAALVASSANAAALLVSGFSENFDSMGTAGTTPPADVTRWNGPSGTSNSTWTSSIPASGVATLVQVTGNLTAVTTPSGTNNNGFNAAASAGNTADRVLATSPTTISGTAIQLSLTNGTGLAQSALTLSYDTIRYTVATTANELPGYWLFFSTNAGSTWTEASSFTPTIATVPNTVGVTSVSNQTLTLLAPLADGDTILFRWVDDNAAQTSPDQIIGLNNVVINPTVVPEPTALGLVAMTGLAALRRRSR